MPSRNTFRKLIPLFVREVRANVKPLIFWSLGMIFMVAASMGKFAAYQGTGQGLNELVSQFPSSVQHLLGLAGLDLASALGYFGAIYSYLVLMAAIHAVSLGAELISKEERDRTSEFLIPKPISRNQIVAAKLLAGFVNLVILNVVTFLISDYLVTYYNKAISVTSEIATFMLGIFFIQLIFFTIGAVIASFSNNAKKTSSTSTNILLGTYILYIAMGIYDKLSMFAVVTPFKYFEAIDIVNSNSLELGYILLSLLLVTGFTLSTFYAYSKRDISY